jgi:D-alanyl-D-alanine carboxypeptidase
MHEGLPGNASSYWSRRTRLGRCKHLLVWGIIVLSFIACSSRARCEPADQRRVVSDSLASLIRQTGVPGVTFAICGANLRQRYSAGLADRETRAPMPPDAVMMGGSTGKVIVAVLTYQEAQAGKLLLGDGVSKYLGSNEAYRRLPGSNDFTIAMLLTHSTGLVDGTVDLAAIRDPLGEWTNDRRFRAAQDTTLLFTPGTAFGYSDLNYQVLAAVLEAIEGKSFERLAEERILRPFGMTATTPAITRFIPGLVSGYAGPTTKPQYEGIVSPDKTAVGGMLFMNPAFEGGGGGFATTSPNLAKFIYTVFNGRVLDQQHLDFLTGEIAISGPPANRDRLPGGLFVFQTAQGKAFGHKGIWFGFKSIVIYYPALRLGAALQVNSQIDGTGADLQVYSINGHRLSMEQALTELVEEAVHGRHLNRIQK